MINLNISKLSVGVIIALSFSMTSCQAQTSPSMENVDNSQVQEGAPNQIQTLSKPSDVAAITPLRLGKKITKVSPYIMANYGFQKLAGAENFQISLFTTAFESMIYENENPLVAILFIQRGDLQEIPLAFYVYGELNPEFNDTLNFCVFDDNIENKLTVYASYSCDLTTAPSTGAITVKFNLAENSVAIDGREQHQLN
jgi:hypothetical protein